MSGSAEGAVPQDALPMRRRLFAAVEGNGEMKRESCCCFGKIKVFFSSQPLFSPVTLLNMSVFGDSRLDQVLFHQADVHPNKQ